MVGKKFYADYGILALMQATRLQPSFDTLKELFERVGLCINLAKTVSMTCHPYCTLGVYSAEAYVVRIIREGKNYYNRLCQRVCCPNCDLDLMAGSL